MFGRRKPSIDPVAQASALLERVTDAQAKQVETFTKFLEMVAELAAKRAASVMGQRSGRARREKKRLASAPRPTSDCPLCVDPTFKQVNVAMIQEHTRHGSPATHAFGLNGANGNYETDSGNLNGVGNGSSN